MLYLGVGEGFGDTRVAQAVEQAINNTLLDDSSIAGAKSLLVNVTGGADLTIHDWNEVSQIITSQVDPNANIIIGLNEEDDLEDSIRVTVIATGFHKVDSKEEMVEKPILKAVGMAEIISDRQKNMNQSNISASAQPTIDNPVETINKEHSNFQSSPNVSGVSSPTRSLKTQG